MEIDQSLGSFWVNPINQWQLIEDGGRADPSQLRVGPDTPSLTARPSAAVMEGFFYTRVKLQVCMGNEKQQEQIHLHPKANFSTGC